MSTYRHTDREMIRFEHELTNLLAYALHRMNTLGYPPVTRHPNEETSCGTYITPDSICPNPAVHTSGQRPQ